MQAKNQKKKKNTLGTNICQKNERQKNRIWKKKYSDATVIAVHWGKICELEVYRSV